MFATPRRPSSSAFILPYYIIIPTMHLLSLSPELCSLITSYLDYDTYSSILEINGSLRLHQLFGDPTQYRPCGRTIIRTDIRTFQHPSSKSLCEWPFSPSFTELLGEGTDTFVNSFDGTPSFGRFYRLSLGADNNLTVSARSRSGRLFEWSGQEIRIEQANDPKQFGRLSVQEALRKKEILCCNVICVRRTGVAIERVLEVKWTGAWRHQFGSRKASRLCDC